MNLIRMFRPLCVAVLVSGLLALVAGCMDTGRNAGGKAEVSKEAVAGYLAEYGLNTSGTAAIITQTVQSGGKYRERIKDEKGNFTTLTAWVDRTQQDVFCITFYRDEVCPVCNGTGRKAMPTFMDTKVSGVALTCQKCGGKGKLENQFHKRCWVLSGGDYDDPEAARESQQEYDLKGAPEGTGRYVKMLSSNDPQLRLDACLWLQANYVRPGVFFRNILPILNRARYKGPAERESLSTKVLGKRLGEGSTVYQLWAAKGLKAENARAYWRIFIEDASGKVIRTEFAPDTTPQKPAKGTR